MTEINKILIGVAALAATIAGCWIGGIRLNLSSSMPIGIYRVVTAKEAGHGDLVTVRLTGLAESLALSRGYLPDAGVDVLKRVAAAPGESIPLHSFRRFETDKNGLAMPLPDEIPLKAGKNEYFIVGDAERSYDSRYFGLISGDQITAVVRPVFTL